LTPDKLTPLPREPTPDRGDGAERAGGPRAADARPGLTAARDEAARALDALDTAHRRLLRARRRAGGPAVTAEDRRLAEAARVLAQTARELTRLVRARTRQYRPGAPARRAEPSRAKPVRRLAEGEPLVTLDLTRRLGPGWRLCQFTSADRDAHRWHVRHDGHACGTVTHYLHLRGERAGWEAHDARGFRLWPGQGRDAYGRTAHLWATRTVAVHAIASAHACP